jgi:DNA-binding IclR family transcriptional regulator
VVGLSPLHLGILRWVHAQEARVPATSLWHLELAEALGLTEATTQQSLAELKALGALDYDLVDDGSRSPAMGYIRLTTDCRRHLKDGDLEAAVLRRGRILTLWSMVAWLA